MSKQSSLEKIDSQIEMLKNKDFVEKKQEKKIKKKTNKPRKQILEEPTIVDNDLMSDLISNNEDTKVFAQKDISKKVDIESTNTKTFFSIYNVSEKQIIDFYLPLFMILLIFVLIFLIFLI